MSKPIGNFKSEIIRQRLDTVFHRILDVTKVDLAADQANIQSLRQQAHAINDTDMELYAINVMGVLYAVMGSDEQALDTFKEGAQLADMWNNRERWVSFQSNIGGIHQNRREYAAAIAVNKAALNVVRTLPETAINVTRQVVMCVNLAELGVFMGDVSLAEGYVNEILSDWESPRFALMKRERRAALVCNTRLSLSWVYAMQGKYKEAQTQALLVQETAKQGDYLQQLLMAHLALVRASVMDPTAVDSEIQWDSFSNLLTQQLGINNEIVHLIAQHLLEEAKLCQRIGSLQWALRYARKTADLYIAIADEAGRQTAEALIAELSTNP